MLVLLDYIVIGGGIGITAFLIIGVVRESFFNKNTK